MGFFDFNRKEGFPTQYEAKDFPVTVDVLECGIITTFLILFLCLITVSIGHPKKAKFFLFTRNATSLLIGLLLMLANFGQDWEVGHIVSKTPYRVGTHHEIQADIGIRIGLRSVNVTLKSDTAAIPDLKGEIINYNERFEWTWDQGRFGFGPYAGLLQRSFRAAQHRGAPLPILWIVDYFVVDGEGFRFGRFYRTAGWYTHILLWAAFPCWLLANILFRSVIEYGACFLAITGLLQLSACLVWGVIRNPIPLQIPFEDSVLRTSFGVSFWFSIVSGALCVVLSAIIMYMEWYHDVTICIFFGIDPLSDYDEYQLTSSEVEVLRKRRSRKNNKGTLDMEMGLKRLTSIKSNYVVDEEEEDEYYLVNQPVVILKRKSTMRRPQLFSRRVVDEDEPLYGNLSTIIQDEEMDEYNAI